jgi:predicted RNA-binding Zn-ribbon protein involved in translation (DUF1610 family)
METIVSNLRFKCPNCGIISQDNVLFLCNTCENEEMIEKEGVYICPKCLKQGENFECTKCGSTEVVFATKKDAKLETVRDIVKEEEA